MEKGIFHQADVAVDKEGYTGTGKHWNLPGFAIETFI